jgi:hypothetical protein
MTDPRPLPRALDAYLADGVNELSDRVLEAALLQIDHTHQRRHLLATWRFPLMTLQTRVAAAAVIGVLAVGTVVFLLRPTSILGPAASPNPSLAATPGPTSTPTLALGWTVVDAPSTDHGNEGNYIAYPDGRVLALGGALTRVGDVFDPTTGRWRTTAPMSSSRSYAVAVRLTDGRVLVAGGAGSGAGATAELWDPSNDRWTPTGSMTIPRGQAFGVTLGDGRVLVAGGGDTASSTTAEIFDPATGTWSRTGRLIAGRASAQIPVVLASGKVLVVGGFTSDPREAELFDPGSGTWSVTGRATTPKGDESTSVTLPDGRVMFFAGAGDVDIYDPSTGTWSAGPAPAQAHSDYLASTLLADGGVLLVSYEGTGLPTTSAEIFNSKTSRWTSAGMPQAAMFVRAAVRLPDGSVLVIGSNKAGGGPLAEIYRPG